MQIISGRFRHRKLHTNPGETTRPITARVKVSLFDRLQPQLQGARVADIYAGTGTMGLEALSRGASRCVFIEQDKVAFELLQKNVAALGIQEETLCWRTDVTRCSFRPQDAEGLQPFDLVFFDPPYVHTSRLARGTMLYKSLLRLARSDITAPDVLLVLRCQARTTFDMPPVWERENLLNYSSMSVHLFRKSAEPPMTVDTADDIESDATGPAPEDGPVDPALDAPTA